MQIRVLGSSGGESPGYRLTCLRINESITLDAGSLTQVLPLAEQLKIRSILLSHSHMDHTNSLPFFVDNVFGRNNGGVEIHASAATIYSLRKYLFNTATWPDFSRLPNHLIPAVSFQELTDEVPVVVDGVTFTPIPVDHVVPTHGFLIEQKGASVLWSSDTGPTHRLWEVANRTPGLKALCIEVSFNNAMQQIADDSAHLTPQTLKVELEKLERRVPILLHHLKPLCTKSIREEIKRLKNPDIEFLEQDRTYDF
jgi:ribonuclease BN (tRNA processing enzyme)